MYKEILQMQRSIIYIMGVSGSGKTTVSRLLSQKLNIPFYDADDFHLQANKEKMKAGQPLNDEDRSEWLQKLNALVIEQQQLKGAIIACSALKQKYRAVLSEDITKPVWIFLQGNYELILDRIKKREAHFMPAALLQSQFDSLEIPAEAFCINIEKAPEEMVELIIENLHKNNL